MSLLILYAILAGQHAAWWVYVVGFAVYVTEKVVDRTRLFERMQRLPLYLHFPNRAGGAR